MDREYLKQASVDDLAAALKNRKEEVQLLRDEVWKIEQELDDRMLAINATELRGETVSVRVTTKKKYGYDIALMTAAQAESIKECVWNEFNAAVQYTLEVRRNPLKALLRRGGRTAELIQQAETLISETRSFEIKPA